MSVDRAEWDAELLDVEELFMKLHTRLPSEMNSIRSLIAERAVALAGSLGDEPRPDVTATSSRSVSRPTPAPRP